MNDANVDFALKVLKNYGADIECPACMQVAFTGSGDRVEHTCGANPQVTVTLGAASVPPAPEKGCRVCGKSKIVGCTMDVCPLCREHWEAFKAVAARVITENAAVEPPPLPPVGEKEQP